MSAFGGEADIAIFTTCETRKTRQQADPSPRAGENNDLGGSALAVRGFPSPGSSDYHGHLQTGGGNNETAGFRHASRDNDCSCSWLESACCTDLAQRTKGCGGKARRLVGGLRGGSQAPAFRYFPRSPC